MLGFTNLKGRFISLIVLVESFKFHDSFRTTDGVLIDGVLINGVLIDGVLIDGVLIEGVLIDGFNDVIRWYRCQSQLPNSGV